MGGRKEGGRGRAARRALTAEESGESSGRGRSLTEIGNTTHSQNRKGPLKHNVSGITDYVIQRRD